MARLIPKQKSMTLDDETLNTKDIVIYGRQDWYGENPESWLVWGWGIDKKGIQQQKVLPGFYKRLTSAFPSFQDEKYLVLDVYGEGKVIRAQMRDAVPNDYNHAWAFLKQVFSEEKK
jgi:hypothetical protein